MPACDACNARYSSLENAAKSVLLDLSARRPISADQAGVMLDWLDKVRTCLWLHQLILKNRVDVIQPYLFVDNRIGKKDRMFSFYKLRGVADGLNSVGNYSLVFLHQPSCFSIRVNDIFLFNASSDFAFSERCGFRTPRDRECVIGGPQNGMTRYGNWYTLPKPQHPIITFDLPRADFQVIQPIFQSADLSSYPGPILEQLPSGVEPLVKRRPRASPQIDGETRFRQVVSATFRFQNELFRNSGKLVGESPKAVAYAEEMREILCLMNDYRAAEAIVGTFASEAAPDQATIHFQAALEAARIR